MVATVLGVTTSGFAFARELIGGAQHLRNAAFEFAGEGALLTWRQRANHG
jgi:hypothetical protein